MPEETPAPETTAKKSPIKTVILVFGIVVIEAVAIIGFFKMTEPDPVSAAHNDGAIIEVDELDKIVELRVIDARLPNNKAGVTYLYDTQVWLQCKQRYADQVNDVLDRHRNEITAEVTAIWRTSDPRHFEEPKLENLTRKVSALIDARFGIDPELGQPFVTKSLIVMQPGFRIDG